MNPFLIAGAVGLGAYALTRASTAKPPVNETKPNPGSAGASVGSAPERNPVVGTEPAILALPAEPAGNPARQPATQANNKPAIVDHRSGGQPANKPAPKPAEAPAAGTWCPGLGGKCFTPAKPSQAGLVRGSGNPQEYGAILGPGRGFGVPY